MIEFKKGSFKCQGLIRRVIGNCLQEVLEIHVHPCLRVICPLHCLEDGL